MKRFAQVAALGLAVFSAAVLWTARPALKPDPQPLLVKIEPGMGSAQIGQALFKEGAIRSPSFFRALALISRMSERLKYGTYQVQRGHYWEILRKMARGDTFRVKVTIPEGWTAYQIAQKLAEADAIADPNAFLAEVKDQYLEGRLFPDTYFFEHRGGAAAAAHQMAQQFNRNFPPEWEARARELNLSVKSVLILGSIIEREARLDPERATISSVYHNRLRKRMALAADPTVQYALGSGRGWKERLTYADLKVDSPYNTYRHAGLPPGPICNPGRKSIAAALYPAQTSYLFFVAEGDGSHSFFERYQDHLRHQNARRRQSGPGGPLKRLKSH